jgi:hypothetical protein
MPFGFKNVISIAKSKRPVDLLSFDFERTSRFDIEQVKQVRQKTLKCISTLLGR